MVKIPFLKKLEIPKLSFGFGRSKSGYVGIDIGGSSVKVVQLRQEKERPVLVSYGELKTAAYLKKTSETTPGAGGFLRFVDSDVAEMINDVIKESNVTSDQAVFSIPAVSSFIAMIDLPRLSEEEIEAAVPYEAKKYIPIPLSEISLDWEIIDEGDDKKIKVLLVAVPREIINKYKRIGEVANLNVVALEVENFSAARSLVGRDKTPTVIVNMGAQMTNVMIVDQGIVRLGNNIERGAAEISRTLSRSLSIDQDRADELKLKVGLSDRPEEKEVVDVIMPLVDFLFHEVLRVVNSYNRASSRKVERVILAGGGANLNGLVNYVTKLMGLETVKANPFSKVVYPAFMQPILREAGPNFVVAVGLALRQITTR